MLSMQNVQAQRALNNSHILKETVVYIDGPLGHQALIDFAARLSDIPVSPGMVWLAQGYGSSPRNRYQRLAQLPGVRVLWSAPCLPLVLYPLSLLAATYGGLLRINQTSDLPECVRELSALAMFEAYLVPEASVPKVETYVREKRWKSFMGQVAGNEPYYFCFGADGDSSDSKTGVFAWVSYGPNCDDRYIQAVNAILST